MLHYHWYKLSYFTILFVALSMFVIETNGGIINMDFALHEEDNKFPPISCVFKHKASEDKSNFNFVKNLLDSKERKYYFIIDREHKNILKYRQKYSFCDVPLLPFSNQEKRTQLISNDTYNFNDVLSVDDIPENNNYYILPPNNSLIIFDDLQTMANTAKHIGYYPTYLIFSAAKMLECNSPKDTENTDGIANFICQIGKKLSPHFNNTRNYIYGLNEHGLPEPSNGPSPKERLSKSKLAKMIIAAQGAREENRKQNERKNVTSLPIFQRFFPSTHAKIGNPLSWQQQKSYASRFYNTYKEEIEFFPVFIKNFVQALKINIDIHEIRRVWEIPQSTRDKWARFMDVGSPFHQASIKFFSSIKRDIRHLERVTTAGALHYQKVFQRYKINNSSDSYLHQFQHFIRYLHANNFYLSKRFRHAIMRRYSDEENEDDNLQNDKNKQGKRLAISNKKQWTGFSDPDNEIQLTFIGIVDMFAYFFEWLLHINSSNGAPFDQPPCNPGIPFLPEAGQQCFYPVLNASSFSFWPVGFNPYSPQCGVYQSLWGSFYASLYIITTPILGPYLSERPQLNSYLGFLVNNATGHVCSVTGISEIFTVTAITNYLCGLNALPPNALPCMFFNLFWVVFMFFVAGFIVTGIVDIFIVVIHMQEIETGKDLGFASTLNGQSFQGLMDLSSKAKSVIGLLDQMGPTNTPINFGSSSIKFGSKISKKKQS